VYCITIFLFVLATIFPIRADFPVCQSFVTDILENLIGWFKRSYTEESSFHMVAISTRSRVRQAKNLMRKWASKLWKIHLKSQPLWFLVTLETWTSFTYFYFCFVFFEYICLHNGSSTRELRINLVCWKFEFFFL